MKRKDKILVAYIVSIIQIILAIIFIIRVHSMGIMSPVYLLCFVVIVVVSCLLLFLMRNRRIAKTIMTIISIVISVLFLVGIVVCGKIDRAIETVVTTEDKEIAHMAVMVLKDDKADSLEDIAGYSVGFFEENEPIKSVMTDIDAAVAEPVIYQIQPDVMTMVDSLLAQECQAIIMNISYLDLIEEVVGYETFSDQIRIIYQKDVEVHDASAGAGLKEDASTKDAFVIYISGIDTYGSINTKSRSDVNILAVVNTKTGKIQLINTPRDYYVELPISNGKKDKLTHAGIYSVDVSTKTLENLYGVEIDYYARLNFSGFESLIDSLGGINVYSEYDFTVGSDNHYTKGYNYLTGAEALTFARERHSFATGDNQRGKNQMAVIVAVIDKLTSKEMIMNFDEVMRNMSGCLQTNMPSDRIYALVKTQLANGTGWDIETYSVTGSNSRNTTYTMPKTTTYVMVPHQNTVDEAKSLIQDVLANK